jgi:hypothetical protein
MWLTVVPRKIAVSTIRRNIKVHWDLLDNGFDWAERFLAFWDVPNEGIWVISLHEEATPLPEYWKVHIQPQVDAAERRCGEIKATRRRRDSATDNNFSKPTFVHLPSSGKIVSCRDMLVEQLSNHVRSPTSGDGAKGTLSIQSDVKNSEISDIDEENVNLFDASTLQQELQDVTHKLKDSEISDLPSPIAVDETVSTLRRVNEHNPEANAMGEDNVALAGGRSCQGKFSDIDEVSQPAKHLQRRSSQEQDEADRLEVEKGWADAVGLLIQLADGLLVSTLDAEFLA